MDNESIFFGQKEKFAIEIKQYKTTKEFYLRLWFQGKGIGDFRRQGSFDYIIKVYLTFINNQSSLYESKFDSLSDLEIIEDVVLILFKDLDPEMEEYFFNRMNIYSFTFGDYQFNNFTFLLLNLENENKVKFLIYEMDGNSKPKTLSYKIETNYFLSTYKSLIKYANENNLTSAD